MPLVFAACSRKAVPTTPLTRQQMRQDIAYLDKKLEKIYPGLGYYNSRETYDNYRDSLVAQLPDSLSNRAFFRRVAPLVNSQKDGHLSFYQPKNITDANTPYLPFVVREVAGKYFIAYNGSIDSTLRRGSELLAIAGQPMRDLHELLADNFRAGADADIPTGRYQRTLVAFPFRYAEWFGAKDSLLVRYVAFDSSRVSSGDTLEKYVLSQSKRTSNKILSTRYSEEKGGSKNLSLAKLDSNAKGVVMSITSFAKYKKWDPLNLKFKRKLRRNFKEIKKLGTENLVIDLRGNGGGAIINSARLLTYLLPEPFSVFRESTLKPGAVFPYVMMDMSPIRPIVFFLTYRRDPATGLWRSRDKKKKDYKPNERYGYRGNLYFLVSGATFSASVSVLAHARNQGVGTLVGDSPGGAYWGDFAARFKIISLPNSKIRVRIPLKTMYHDVKPQDDHEIKPDFPVSRTYKDIVTPNRDYGLEYVKALIRKDK